MTPVPDDLAALRQLVEAARQSATDLAVWINQAQVGPFLPFEDESGAQDGAGSD
jgi:hypothetical protein